MGTSGSLLADFSTDRRLLWLCRMAAAVSLASALAADGLLQLIALIASTAWTVLICCGYGT
ncbi:MAG: hypothetical protein JO015_13075 [Verrucomicrobia bacterium]|nr:hypothetical protein [Verrucomicrobiota bacterium]